MTRDGVCWVAVGGPMVDARSEAPRALRATRLAFLALGLVGYQCGAGLFLMPASEEPDALVHTVPWAWPVRLVPVEGQWLALQIAVAIPLLLAFVAWVRARRLKDLAEPTAPERSRFHVTGVAARWALWLALAQVLGPPACHWGTGQLLRYATRDLSVAPAQVRANPRRPPAEVSDADV